VSKHEPKRVYLAGTITADQKYLDWRVEVAEEFRKWGIQSLNPCRGKDPKDWRYDGLDANTVGLVYSNGGFVARDERDIQRADVLLLVFMADLAPARQSIGTFSEFGFAHGLSVARGRTLPVVVASDMPEVVEHPFIQQWATRVEPTVERAVSYIKFLLS
jgi:hypothetical protein